MTSLWADGWFYVSGGGFLISSVLFVFLLGQYRATVEAEDEMEDVLAPADTGPAKVPKPVVFIADDGPAVVALKHTVEQPSIDKTAPSNLVQPIQSAAAKAIASVPVVAAPPASAAAPSAAPASLPVAERRKGETLTGGVSPAVVYLQNLKLQVERMEKEIHGLKSLASQQTAQGEIIIKRLNEWVEKAGKAPANVEPLSKPAPAINPTFNQPAEVPAPIEPVGAANVAPVAETQKETLQELKLVLPPSPVGSAKPGAAPSMRPKVSPAGTQDAGAAAPAPVQEPQQEAQEPKARKGPVWPI